MSVNRSIPGLSFRGPCGPLGGSLRQGLPGGSFWLGLPAEVSGGGPLGGASGGGSKPRSFRDPEGGVPGIAPWGWGPGALVGDRLVPGPEGGV
ncbi:hypothetical protein ATOP_19230 [Granulimonas faecalis]|uniref:Uncharacterized protein n=1 Tax=Granulimonas faecalis TaxID=2894155 RepID=A0AAV5B8R8_9ACTN|nr:hypothetical protein ATOP_19230 [Granulimonas faecalis]